MFFNFRFLKIALAAIFFCSLLLSEVSLAKPKDEKSFHELEEIRAEISLLNLLRGLYLSKDQAKKVIEIANRAQAFRDETKQLLERDYENVKEDFTGLRDSLFQPVGKEKPFQNKASVLNDRIKEAREVTQEKIAGLEDEARLVLSSAQLEIIDGFKPCLVPPKDLSNPVRVGQASAEGGKLEKLVELIHSTPETVWKERGDSLLAKVANHIEAESGEMTPDMKSDIKARLSKTAGKIRQASDVDFVLKKNTLESEMLLINPKKTLSHEHRKSGKIAQWLLSPTAFSVLPKWLESLDKQTPPDSTIEETPSNPSDESALAENGFACPQGTGVAAAEKGFQPSAS
ncbi:hypothetical protein HYY75_08685 [bacterium]|nr:hypothetical protein [bacterium]